MEEAPTYLFSEQDDFSTSVEKKARRLLIFIFINMVITVLLLSRERADFRRKSNATFCSFLESSSSLFPEHFERRRVETVFIKKLDWEKSVQGPESKDKGPVQRTACEQ